MTQVDTNIVLLFTVIIIYSFIYLLNAKKNRAMFVLTCVAKWKE